MRIKEITSGSIVIEIDPGICLALASACNLAATTASEDGHTTHTEVFDALHAAFDAYALVSVARCGMGGRDEEEYTFETVRREWGFLPLILGGKEVLGTEEGAK